MADINVEMLKEKLYPAVIALSCISEVCVDVSKRHINAEDAIDKIRGYLRDTDVIGSRYRLDKLIEECMVPIVSNSFDDKQSEWLKKTLQEYPLQTFETNYPSCCDGCSNNPKNGGSGICNCTLPYMQNPTVYNNTTPIDDFCMTATNSTGVYIVGSEKPSANRIIEAVERTKKYLKE